MRLAPLILLLALAACASETDPFEQPGQPEPTAAAPAAPALETRADSVAWRVVQASGGLEAWEALPVLQFEFGLEQGGQQLVVARHLWEKRTGRYRVEWPADEIGTYVGLFAAWPDELRVYFNGEPVTDPELVETARRRTINDTYWLLAPLKLFDAGVLRTYAPDSSDASTDAIHLAFENVGMTPGDQYWLFVDKQTGLVERWTFVLETDPSRTPRTFRWTDYRSLRGPQGPVILSARKEAGGRAVLTDQLRAPASVDRSLFTDPQPRL